ncbi:MAG TPA: 50S ribosomal protein L25 [Tepidiformaceae bacterium]|nr:50S ribosomal protein L25 [Tepidiformaceae bacterium]
MADRTTLTATPRTILGKKVKQLRRQGILPANIYGRGVESAAIQVDSREFGHTIKTSGIRHMFEIAVEGETKPRYVVIRGLTRKGGTGDPIHVDFFQVDLDRPITTNVTLRVEGEAPAVRDLAGTLVHSLDVVAVRCKPLAIPDVLVADASLLKSFDVSLTVGDLHAPDGVEIVTDPSVVIATVTPPRLRLDEEEEGEAAEAEAAPAPEDAEETEAAE